MGDLSPNISRHEIACKCGCGLDSMDIETIEIVQATCDYFAEKRVVDKVVLDITSGARCLEYNRSVGSSDGSQHPKCRAIDFRIRDVTPDEIYAYLVGKYPDKYGFGRYGCFTHVDTRTNGPARWG